MKHLSKKTPVTIEQARTQVLWLKIRSTSNKNKEREIQHNLKMYYPDWTEEQIESERKKLMEFATLNFQDGKRLIEERLKEIKKSRDNNERFNGSTL